MRLASNGPAPGDACWTGSVEKAKGESSQGDGPPRGASPANAAAPRKAPMSPATAGLQAMDQLDPTARETRL